MCGICGAISEQSIDLRKMVQSIKHRGPDYQGVFQEGVVSLGHARLSILDLSNNANQPMVSQSGQCVIAYNGEVYNFSVLKKELESAGITFQTHSDTEVVLEGYEYWGDSLFSRLNGMFAFAIFDKRKQSILLVRDRFGIKPLYYYQNGNDFVFGSEIKSLLASTLVSTSLNFQGLHEYLHFSTTLGETSFYKGVNKLLPGNQLTFDIDSRRVRIMPYQINYDVSPVADTLDVAIDKIRDMFEESVKSQLVADVPVGVFLSGGIDSTAITAFASKHYNGKLKTFSAGFDFDKGVNELPNARYIAEHFGTEHQEIHIKGNAIPDVLAKLNNNFDQPFGDAANIPLYLMSKELKGKHKVVLQGDGGDELFAGYHRYRRLHFYKFFKIISKITIPFRAVVPKNHPRYRNFKFLYALYQCDKSREMAYIMSQEMFDEDPVGLFADDFRQRLVKSDPFDRYEYFYNEFKELDNVQRMLYTDMNVILPDLYFEKVDRATMANSLEVRVPFLDNDLVAYAMGLPSAYKIKGKEMKFLLKKAFHDIVPHKILYGPKKGFSVPFQYWLKTSMNDFMFDTIKSNSEIYSSKVELLMREHTKGEKDNGYILWKLLNFSMWLNKNKEFSR